MKFKLMFIIIIVCITIGCVQSIYGQTNDKKEFITENNVLEKSFQGGSVVNYFINLDEAEFIIVEVEQIGIDVFLEFYNSGNVKIADVDSTNGDQGPEIIYLIANIKGSYRLCIKSDENNNKMGKYKIRIIEKRKTKPEDNFYVKAQSQCSKGYILRHNNKDSSIKEALVEYKSALGNWILARQKQKEADTLYLIGLCNNEINEYYEAKKYFANALKLELEINDKYGQPLTLLGLGEIYVQLKDYNNGKDYLFKALMAAKEIKDTQVESSILINIGSYFFIVGNYSESSNYFNKAMQLCNETGNKDCLQEIKNTVNILLTNKK